MTEEAIRQLVLADSWSNLFYAVVCFFVMSLGIWMGNDYDGKKDKEGGYATIVACLVVIGFIAGVWNTQKSMYLFIAPEAEVQKRLEKQVEPESKNTLSPEAP